jgi:phosphoglycolate phosphatase-like HAD superfamily hydrolase
VLGRDFAPDAVVVIGDTPADIECGRAIGAGTIGVATGRYPTAVLRRAGADAVFEDLSDTDAVIRVINNE